MNTLVNVKNDLTAAQKKDLSDKLEQLMVKYTICPIDTKSEDYFAGVVDGLNNAFKLVNEINDDYSTEELMKDTWHIYYDEAECCYNLMPSDCDVSDEEDFKLVKIVEDATRQDALQIKEKLITDRQEW